MKTRTREFATPGRIERLCEKMHVAYEVAASVSGWQTQEASRCPWSEVPEANKAAMRIAVRAMLLDLTLEGWINPRPLGRTPGGDAGGEVVMTTDEAQRLHDAVVVGGDAAGVRVEGEVVRSRVECLAAADALEGAIQMLDDYESQCALARLADQWRAEAETVQERTSDAIAALLRDLPTAGTDEAQRQAWLERKRALVAELGRGKS